MAVYREFFSGVDKIVDAQRRIWPDAADFGVPVKKDDVFWNTAAQLASWYGDPETRHIDVYSTGTTVSIEIEGLDEWAVSDERKTEEQATYRFKLEYITTRSDKKMDGYISLTRLK